MRGAMSRLPVRPDSFICPTTSDREINRSTHRCHLCPIALLWRCPRTVGIDLSGRFVWGAGDACTEAELLEGVVNDSRRDHRRSDDRAVAICRRDVWDFRHGRDHRLLEFRLRIFAIVDQIEAVWDFTGLVRYAVTSGQRRAKLGF